MSHFLFLLFINFIFFFLLKGLGFQGLSRKQAQDNRNVKERVHKQEQREKERENARERAGPGEGNKENSRRKKMKMQDLN